ncbi:MAG TPA: response regulator transcription factor [bacterium]|jgi:DNA-binding response OmpR family regulator|nr:response regulator transcription factor [bacterium]
MTKIKILLVEDQKGFRRVYGDLLESQGYEVLLAEDGEEGWRISLEARPDLILLDLGLPKLDGFGVLQRLRGEESTRDIPVIIFSVMGEEKDIQKARGMGANDYAIKGQSGSKEILAKIRALLAPAQDAQMPPDETQEMAG